VDTVTARVAPVALLELGHRVGGSNDRLIGMSRIGGFGQLICGKETGYDVASKNPDRFHGPILWNRQFLFQAFTGTEVAAPVAMAHDAIRARALLNLTFLPASLRKHLEAITHGRFQPHFVVAFTLWLVGAVEIIQKTTGQRLDPRFWMLIAVLITAYSGVRIFRLLPKASNAGRRKRSTATEAFVSRIADSGLTVFEADGEMKGSDGYVVVGPGGVYTMEVRERNVFGSRTIELGDDNELVIGGRIADGRPLTYACAAAEKVREQLHDHLPIQPMVKPVVVFVNDWEIKGGQNRDDVTVLNENEVQHYFSKQNPVLNSADLAKISACLD